MINTLIYWYTSTSKVLIVMCLLFLAHLSAAQVESEPIIGLDKGIALVPSAKDELAPKENTELRIADLVNADSQAEQIITDEQAIEIAKKEAKNPPQIQPEPELTRYGKKKRASELRRTVYVIEPFANMRTGPGRAYPIRHVLEQNEKAIILKKRTNWLKVKTRKDHVGWVRASQFQASFSEQGQAIEFQQPVKQAFLDRKIEVGLLGGTLDSASSLTYFASYHFTPNISGEIQLAESFGNFSTRKVISARLTHQMYPSWIVSPMFSLGAGIVKTSPDANLAQSQDREDNMLSVGAGFITKISRRFFVRIEYENNVVLTTRETNEEVEQWKAGFGVYF